MKLQSNSSVEVYKVNSDGTLNILQLHNKPVSRLLRNRCNGLIVNEYVKALQSLESDKTNCDFVNSLFR